MKTVATVGGGEASAYLQAEVPPHRALFTHQKVLQSKKFRFRAFSSHKRQISSLYLGCKLQQVARYIYIGH